MLYAACMYFLGLHRTEAVIGSSQARPLPELPSTIGRPAVESAACYTAVLQLGQEEVLQPTHAWGDASSTSQKQKNNLLSERSV